MNRAFIHYNILMALLCVFTTRVSADENYRLPIDMEPFIAGNYGELRPNHFHAGLDFKTQQSIGHPVYAFADGYVERIGINAYGYGLVVYLNHPKMKRMTVYGHLSSFSDTIWKKVRERQVKEELNNADITFGPDEIPIKMGDVIALSGNTGSSGGPHVHFEVRGLMSAPGKDDEEWYDPMAYFLDKLKDTTAPKITNLYIYENPTKTYASHRSVVNRTTTAWGKVAFGIKTFDMMDGASNHYGVKKVKLFADDKLIYNWDQEFFQYAEQRYTNSVIDFPVYFATKSMIMKTFIDPCNKLRMIDHSIGDGIIDINEARAYKMRYELEDAHGNKTTLNFVVNGVKNEKPVNEKIQGKLIPAGKDISIDTLGCRFFSPAGNLYTDIDFTFSCYKPQNLVSANPNISAMTTISPIYKIGSTNIPIHSWCTLMIDLPDSIDSVDNLYIANLDGVTYKGEFVKGLYFPITGQRVPAALKAKVREFGRFTIRRDTTKPTAAIIGRATFRAITLSMADTGSGVNSWKVYIDGKFVPFDRNNTGRIVGHPNEYGIKQGGSHAIEIHVFDLVGNEGILKTNRVF